MCDLVYCSVKASLNNMPLFNILSDIINHAAVSNFEITLNIDFRCLNNDLYFINARTVRGIATWS